MITTQHLIDEALDMRELSLAKLRREKAVQIEMRQQHAMATGVRWNMSLDTAKRWYRVAEEMLQTAETFVWTAGTERQVVHAATKLPDDVPFHRAWLPCPIGYWWLGRDSVWTVKSDANREYDSTVPVDRTICAVTYYATGGDFADPSHNHHILFEALSMQHGESFGPTSVMAASWEEGETLAQFLTRVRADSGANNALWNEQIEVVARLIMSACLWMQQKVVAIGRGLGSRPQRRRLEKQDINSTTRIVTLRKVDPERYEPTGDGTPLQWRIPVTGHWRNQPYADGVIIPIWIEDHWRGPKDAPVKAPARVIYKVSR